MFLGGSLPSLIKLQPEKRYTHLAFGWNKSQITVWCVKIRTPPITLWFKKILIGFFLFYRNNEIQTFCYCVSLSCFVWIYNLTVTIVSKNIKNFLGKQKLVDNHSIPSMHAERKITVHSHKHSFTPYPFLSPYSRTVWLMEK